MNPERLRQIEELYHSARECEPDKRSAFLSGACRDDPELRREVESLLAQDPAREGMLDRPAAALLEDSAVMMLSAGARLGPYQIEARIGAGGMGEVYRAIDTRLGRAVAIKITQEKFSDRFEREARAISALNHPNICTLYDVGPNYLVMEFVEGETLATRLKKGALPIDLVSHYGAGVADALAAAHAKEIVHRDLKPGNIMVTKSGIKVLDFGLAKTQRDGTLTASRAIMGTPAYMAPEQSEGKECDSRTDIYALGLVLREMATGQREGPTSSLPPQLAHVIDRCLAPEPESRWQTARDMKAELEWAPPTTVVVTEPSRRWWAVTAAGLLLCVLGGIAIWGWLRPPPAAPRPVTRWTTTLPAYEGPPGRDVSISRDGTLLAYYAGSGSSGRIWLRLLNQPEGKPIPGTEGGSDSFFSPDGQWLAFFTGGDRGKLMKVPVTGGIPITLCDDGRFGGSWGEDDRIIFSRYNEGLMRVSASGGACENLTTPDQPGTQHSWPQILPGGQSILFTIGTEGSFDRARIAVLDLKTRRSRVVVNGGSSARYVPSGHLVYVRGGTMFAVPFDLKRLAVTGSEVPVIDGVVFAYRGGYADYAFSDSGLLVYTEDAQASNTLEWLDRQGKSQAFLAPPQDYQDVRLSPDGQRAALMVGRSGVSGDIWILELVRGALTRLTSEGIYSTPIWTPDGRRVVFDSLLGGKRRLYWAPADGSSKPEPLLDAGVRGPNSWTPDGKTLLYESSSSEFPGNLHIWTLQPPASGGDGKPKLLFEASPFDEGQAVVSRDGRWVAYTSSESGKYRVYVRPFPGPGGKTPISIEGGMYPRWSGDGRELFYRDPEKKQLMAVNVQTTPAFRAGLPHALFALGDVGWDVAPDGKRFLVVKEPQSSVSEAKLQVVMNWFEELRQKAPKR
jgi:Tol biopolymer transport system component/predicted Ser/Thr protein kinase